MADLKALAESMRKWARTARELGDDFCNEGNDRAATEYWGKADGYEEAAQMVDAEIEREASDV